MVRGKKDNHRGDGVSGGRNVIKPIPLRNAIGDICANSL
jgi:hypothetical protein